MNEWNKKKKKKKGVQVRCNTGEGWFKFQLRLIKGMYSVNIYIFTVGPFLYLRVIFIFSRIFFSLLLSTFTSASSSSLRFPLVFISASEVVDVPTNLAQMNWLIISIQQKGKIYIYIYFYIYVCHCDPIFQ